MFVRPTWLLRILTAAALAIVLLWWWWTGFHPTASIRTHSSNIDSTAWRSILPKGPALPNATDYAHTPLPDPAVYAPIKTFWSKWAQQIYDAQPTTEKIKIKHPVTAILAKQDGPREPFESLLKLAEEDIVALSGAHRKLVYALNSASFPAVFSGQGIVAVGGGEYFGPLLVSLQLLREQNETLPMEVFVDNLEELHADQYICDTVLPALNARCLVLEDFLTAADVKLPTVSRYQLKVLAMLFSSFSSLLFLDSDSIPLVPASELLQTAPFLSRGLVLYPDFWASTEDPVFYRIAGLTGFPENLPATSCESGQVLVDKSKHVKTLLLAAYYNIYGNGYYYPLLSQGALGMGDKETFLAAAVALGAEYWRVKSGVDSVGRDKGGRWERSGMVQVHPGDDFAAYGVGSDVTIRKAFIHANTPKMNAGHLVDEGDLFDGGKRLRLWGDGQGAREPVFGKEVEKNVWRVVVQQGCELAGRMRDWKGRQRVCERLLEHWRGVFA